MAMGKSREEQEQLFATHQDLRASGGHPFYEALNRVLKKNSFDRFVEDLCQPFYAKKMGRPGVAPGVYFRCLLLGYFEGIDSERGIAWRAADSMSLRHFLGLPLGKNPPDHSTLSRTRRLIDIETHKKVFTWILGLLAEAGLLKGKTIGVDGTTLEANAALRSIVRRDDGQGYTDFLTDLAKTSGIETPTRQDLARIDRKRPKKGSNKDWVHPLDPEAEIMKMKDGRTHLAHKQEQAVDMETGAIVAVTLSGGAAHDTKTVEKTLEEADNNLGEVRERADDKTAKRVSDHVQEAVLDKGYHSNAVLLALDESEIRSYVSEPDRGTRRWKDKQAERDVVYANRRRIRGDRGKALLRKRGELLERPFAHALETGGMRRTHLRHHENILKRLVVHIAGINLSLLMRKLVGVGKPRCLQGRSDLAARLLAALLCLWAALVAHWARAREVFAGVRSNPRSDRDCLALGTITPAPLVGDGFTTAC
jgi:transposase